ncbi:MAG: hypothetical protein JO332_10955 [Planctomycetaceae bacterium]|nr:hypothetical protein [Planctomycetaceae bacterium]
MRRRLTTGVLAAFYLLQATWLLHAGVDVLFPRIQQLVSTPDACCARACGCPEEAQKAHACCCAKDQPAPVASAPAPISSIEEARCKGVEAAMAQAFTQPVVCSVLSLTLPVVVVARIRLPELQPFQPPSSLADDKVPIAQA